VARDDSQTECVHYVVGIDVGMLAHEVSTDLPEYRIGVIEMSVECLKSLTDFLCALFRVAELVSEQPPETDLRVRLYNGLFSCLGVPEKVINFTDPRGNIV
jgi:hypothetical protein